MVWSRFARGMVEVPSWYGRGSLAVWSRFARGMVEVRLWYGQGSLAVWSRFPRVMVLVLFGTLTFYCFLLYMHLFRSLSYTWGPVLLVQLLALLCLGCYCMSTDILEILHVHVLCIMC